MEDTFQLLKTLLFLKICRWVVGLYTYNGKILGSNPTASTIVF